MEPEFQWQYSGVVTISRTSDPEGRGDMELPFYIVSAAGPNDEQLTNEEIDAAAAEIANAFLNTLQTSDPKHRQDYGSPTSVFLTSIVMVQI